MQLTRREKAVVIGGVGGLLLLMGMQFLVRPTRERIATLRRIVSDKREVLIQIQGKSREYGALQAEVGRLASTISRQQEGRTVLSTIERVRKECELPHEALSFKPTTTAFADEYQQIRVDIRLEGVTLEQLIAFLSRLESLSWAGGVRSLEIRHAERDAGLLRGLVEVAAVIPTKGR